MKLARSYLMIILGVLIVLPAAPAWADNAADARAAFARARDHFKTKNYREAMVELKTAYKLKPHPSLLRYMGDTYYKMNKARQAIKIYRKYLKMAPMAADKERIEAKVRQLELIVGSADDDDDEDARPAAAPPPPPPPAAAPRRAPARAAKPAKKIDLRPTGEDTEDPLAQRRPKTHRATRRATGGGKADKPNTGLTVAKWGALGVGVASLALGIVFNRMAAADGDELEEAVRSGCFKDPNKKCLPNPDMNDPKVSYSAEHHDMAQSHKLNNSVSIATFITGGVLIGTGVVLFIMDRPSKKRRRADSGSNIAVAPMVTGEVFGVAGEVRF